MLVAKLLYDQWKCVYDFKATEQFVLVVLRAACAAYFSALHVMVTIYLTNNHFIL